MATNSNYNPTELESIQDFSILQNNAVATSKHLPRWKRKQLAAQKSGTPTRRGGSTPGSKKKRSTPFKGDRFIPQRNAMDFDLAHHNLTASGEDCENEQIGASSSPSTHGEQEFDKTLKAGMLNGGQDESSTSRVLAFRNKAPKPDESYHNALKAVYTQNKGKGPKSGKLLNRVVADQPTRILDAPDLMDDYYLNLISWSAQNVLAVALGTAVYLWNADTGDINELCNADEEGDMITSLSFIKEGGNHLAIGLDNNETQLWDTTQLKKVRTMNGHSARVSSLSWNGHILSSGSRDSTIVNHDVRIRDHNVACLEAHQQEVCGLSWSHDGKTLASGGNDNLLCLWDAQSSSRNIVPRHELRDHQAAVKALAWCPFERNVLASGGGTADRCIKLWNSANGACLNSVDTGSQVCSLLWSKTEKELLSSHGFSQNQLTLWSYPRMQKLKELKGHTARVLHMAASPNGTTVVSAAADETLRFWDVFAAPSAKSTKTGIVQRSGLMSGINRIR